MDITNRIDAVTNISDIRLQMGGIQPAPKSVKIELTNKCNLNCKYCATSMREHKGKAEMDFWLFQRITEDMRVSGVEEIGLFFLGESMMAPALLNKAISWCKKEMDFPYVFLTSNATLGDAEFVEMLMASGLDSLKWSVNFASEEKFKEVTQSSANLFHRALKNIKEAYWVRFNGNYKTMLSASSILYDEDYRNASDRFLDDHVRPYVDRHYWLPLYQMAMYHDHVKKTMGYVPTAGNMGRIDDSTGKPNRKPLPCWTAFTEGHIRVDGNVSACCFGNDARFDMGVLDGTNFMRQWNSAKFAELRKAQLRTRTEGQDALKGTPCEVCVVYG